MDRPHVRKVLANASNSDLEDYKKWLKLDPAVSNHDFFRAENRTSWVNAWIDWPVRIQILGPLREYIVISDDSNGGSHKPINPNPKKCAGKVSSDVCPAKRVPPAIIEILSDSEDDKSKVKVLPQPVTVSNHTTTGTVRPASKIAITRKVKVDAVVHLAEVPARWPIPEINTTTAFIVDFGKNVPMASDVTVTGKSKGLDGLIKLEILQLDLWDEVQKEGACMQRNSNLETLK
ncbi:hypothetical protein H0H81_001279 [Sphagnurus paluster]|uniref:Uncharacterized protein n=1 Tax=Sphagnurus paluster TaxID=117069 RepID=A0A9P7FSN7_9AGAR|nr:hypothetical protein H0H81_001279 [Sphagnurus paluster]